MFESLFAPLTREEWLARSGDGGALVLREPSGLPRWLDERAFADVLLHSDSRYPDVRAIATDSEVTPSSFCRTMRLGQQLVHGMVRIEALERVHRAGATLVVERLERKHHTLAEVVPGIARALQCEVSAAALRIPAGHQVKLRGDKRMGVLLVMLSGSVAFSSEDLAASARPGERILVPDGQGFSLGAPHEATLVLSLSLKRTRWLDLLLQAAGATCNDLEAEPDLRQGISAFAPGAEQNLLTPFAERFRERARARLAVKAPEPPSTECSRRFSRPGTSSGLSDEWRQRRSRHGQDTPQRCVPQATELGDLADHPFTM